MAYGLKACSCHPLTPRATQIDDEPSVSYSCILQTGYDTEEPNLSILKNKSQYFVARIFFYLSIV